jgi:hypothetical protein
MPQILWYIVYKFTLECHKFSGILRTNLPWNAKNSLVYCVQITLECHKFSGILCTNYLEMSQILWYIVYKFTLECHKFSGILCTNLALNATNSLVFCVQI